MNKAKMKTRSLTRVALLVELLHICAPQEQHMSEESIIRKKKQQQPTPPKEDAGELELGEEEEELTNPW
jgi:hypothetical protein